jgi:hypothetical protein
LSYLFVRALTLKGLIQNLAAWRTEQAVMAEYVLDPVAFSALNKKTVPASKSLACNTWLIWT